MDFEVLWKTWQQLIQIWVPGDSSFAFWRILNQICLDSFSIAFSVPLRVTAWSRSLSSLAVDNVRVDRLVVLACLSVGVQSQIHCYFLSICPLWCSILRWGWVFLERTQILSGIQFTTYFIESFVVETKRFVGSFVNVILTRQTCGQRSSRPAESKRRAIGNFFSERICYLFLILKCRGDWDLGLCTTAGRAFGEPQHNDNFRFFLRRNTFFFWKSPLRCGSPNSSPEVVHRPGSRSPLHFDIRNI